MESNAYAARPELAGYHVILVSTSAGKDSQAMLDEVVREAEAAGVKDRIVAVHADLGRVEWEGVKELAAEQAAHYGVRFEVVRREKGDLLAQVEQRGMWPSNKARYCTSDHKRAQVYRLLTKLVEELKLPKGEKVRILYCMGLRAEESPARAKKASFEFNRQASNGKRHVDTWLPIHGWTTGEVWARIRKSGVRHHRAYDLGMPRLSCCFCIFAPKNALVLAGKHNRGLLDQYVAVERRINHTFKANLSLVQIQTAVEAGEEVNPEEIVWAQCA